MIVMEDRKIVIITPPHTASGNLHKTLCKPPYSAYWVLGKWAKKQRKPDHHSAVVPGAWIDYNIALVWRDPIKRLGGLFLHLNWWRTKKRNKDSMTWDEFIEHVISGESSEVWEFYCARIADFVKNTRVDTVIRFSNLNDDINKLLCDTIALPPANHHELPAIDSSNLTEWAKPDYELLKRIG